MNDFMRIDEPEVPWRYGLNFLIERRKHFTMIPKPVCYKVRFAIFKFVGRTPGQLASI